MRNIIHPSPAVIARADTPVLDCVRLMKKRNVGSVLVVSDSLENQLLGIFTERDLLNNFERLQTEGLWARPIRTLMSHPVKVIHLNRMHLAPAIMLQNGFRHLPVVVSDAKVKFRLLGVISMRDLFKKMTLPILEEEQIVKPVIKAHPLKPITARVVSPDRTFFMLLRAGLPKNSRIILEPANLDGVVLSPTKSEILILDIDDIKADKWIALLKLISKRRQKPLTIMTFTPEFMSPNVIKVLEKLGSTPDYAIFTKPLEVIDLFETILKKTGRIKS